MKQNIFYHDIIYANVTREVMLKRKIYRKIDEWMKRPQKDALVIRGVRQVGKTFLIEKYLKDNCSNYQKLDFVENKELADIFKGNLDADTISNGLRLYFPNIIPDKTILFFDEIQVCPHAWTSLKYLALDGRFRIIASGSLLGLLHKKSKSKTESEPESDSNPVGYAEFMDMYPLDFEEFLWALGLDENQTADIKSNIAERRPYSEAVLKRLDEYFSIYMIVGGMPEAVAEYVSTKDFQSVNRVQRMILDGYRMDVTRYAPDSDKGKILACFDSMPAQLSQESKKFSYKLIESDLTPAYRTYEGAIDWMRDAAIVYLCSNISAPAEPLKQNKLDNQFKVYMCDTGLLVCMLGINTVKSIMSGDTRVNRGAVAENVVADGIRRSEAELVYFRKGSLEIDFITVLGSSVSAIEVKSGNNRKSRSLDSLKEKYGVKRRMKFEKSNIWTDDKGIEHYPLFTSSFIDALAPKPRIDLSYDIEDLKSLLRSEQSKNDRLGEWGRPRKGASPFT